MKLILVILFIAFAALAQVPQETVNNWMLMAVPRGATCSTYNTTNAWDNFIEGFQTATTGYESNVWTGVGTTANIYPAADTTSLTTYKPDGACSQALKVVMPNDGTETYAQADLGSAIDLDTIQTDITFNMYIVGGTVGSTHSYAVFRYTESTTGPRVQISESSGQYNVSVIAATTSGTIAIAADQWYTIRLSLDTAAAAGGSKMQIFSNGSQVSTDKTFQRNTALDLRYLRIGSPVSLDAGESGTIYFDTICIKTN